MNIIMFIRSLLFKVKYKEYCNDEYWLLRASRKDVVEYIYLKYGGSLKDISDYIDQNYDIYRIDENGRNSNGPYVLTKMVGITYEKFINIRHNRNEKINEILND